jgi:hypothetical protein
MIGETMEEADPTHDTFVEIDLSEPETNGKALHADHNGRTETNQEHPGAIHSIPNGEPARTGVRIKDNFHGRNVLALGGRLVCGPPEE